MFRLGLRLSLLTLMIAGLAACKNAIPQVTSGPVPNNNSILHTSTKTGLSVASGTIDDGAYTIKFSMGYNTMGNTNDGTSSITGTAVGVVK